MHFHMINNLHSKLYLAFPEKNIQVGRIFPVKNDDDSDEKYLKKEILSKYNLLIGNVKLK